MITAYKWHSIARTTTIGASTGIRVEFGESYRILLTTSIDWGNAVISVQNSNLSNTIVASVRLRQNGIHYYLDLKVSQSFSTDFKIELYDNTYWEESSGVSDLAGATLCIIDDINSINTPSSYGESFFQEDENGDLVPIPKSDGTPRGIWTNSFMSSGGRNTTNPGGGGGISYFDIIFENDPDTKYPLSNGVVTLPAYPTIPNLSNYITKDFADTTYLSKTEFKAFKDIFDSMFAFDKDGYIHAKKSLWSDGFLSSGGKNASAGEGGGGISSFIIKLGEDEYALENGVVALPAYPEVPNVDGFLTQIQADGLYLPKATFYALSDAVRGDALNAKKLGGNLPSYYATDARVTEVNTALTTLRDWIESMFEIDADGHIKAKKGLYTDSFLSSGGKNTTEGTTGGGLTEFSVIFNGKQYDSSNGVATIDGTYATSDAVNNAIATSKSYTDTSIANLINGAPTTLDTLKEIADAMAANENVVDALEEAIGTKASQSDLDALSGRVTTTESSISTNKTAISTLQGYFTNGIAKEAAKVSNIFKIIFNGTTYEYNGSVAKEINFSATNIVSALGTTPVNRAKGDESGNNIKSTYATKDALQDFIDKIEKYFTFGEDNIKANYGLWTDSYLSSGGQNTEGGSGGGGITAFDIMFEGNNDDKYPLENGKVVLPAYPTTLPASDVPDWAKKSSLAASDVPNLSWNKITSDKPTTLSGYGITDFIINTTSSIDNVTTNAGIYRLGSTAPDKAGYGNAITLRFPTSDTYGQLYIPYYMATPIGGVYWRGATSDNTTQSWRLMLDESNYSSYALPLSGGTIKDSVGMPLVLNTASSTSVILKLQILGSDRVQLGYNTTDGVFISSPAVGYRLGITTGGTPIFYNGVNRTLIHSGNIGNQSVASATKLVNANGYTYATSYNVDKIAVFGDGTAHNGYKTYIDGTSITLRYGTTSTTGLILNSSGNVTIGASDLAGTSYKLYANGNIASLGTSNIFDATGTNTRLTLYMNQNIGRIYAYNSANKTDHDLWIGGAADGKALTVKANGNVGIGTDTPTSTLHVNGSFRAGSSILDNLTVYSSASLAAGYIHFTRTGNTSYNSGWFYGVAGNEAMAFINNAATSSFMFVQGKTTIENWNTDTWQSVTPALQIKQNCVAINYLWGQNVTPDYTLRVVGTAYFSGNIYAGGDIEAFNSSDARLKENITTIPDDRAIDILSRLNPVTFAWNEIATSLSSRLQGASQGFIAQEWEKIIPNASGTMWGKYKGIDYIQTIPYLTKGWQIHETKIERLEREVKELKDKLAKYESIS